MPEKGAPDYGAMPWGDVARGALGSLGATARNVIDAAMPQNWPADVRAGVEQLKSLAELGGGALSKVGGVMQNLTATTRSGVDAPVRDTARKAKDEALINAVGRAKKEQYTTKAGFKKALATDPLSIPADLSMLIGPAVGGAKLARELADAAGAARAAGHSAKVIDTIEQAQALNRASGELPAPKSKLVGEPPASGVVPANKGTDGKVYVGQPGDLHFSVAERHPHAKFTGELGFVNPAGEYLTREEALDWVNANGSHIRPSENMPGQLDATDYREQAGRTPRAVETPEGTLVVQPRVAPRTVPAARDAGDIDELRALLRQPEHNQPAAIANEHALEALGSKYDVNAPKPVSSLEKQSGIGRAFGMAAEGSPEYKHALFERYGETMPELVEKTGAQNYDQLTEAAYRALGDEAKTQFNKLPVRTTYHHGALEYPVPSAMMRDVLAEGNLNVFRGGDKHPFLSEIDPETGLSSNEMFRAVHDYFGHVPQGNTFRAPGEEAAYASHAQMTPELARMALMSETRGQNSFVNYTPINADIIDEMEGIKSQLKGIKESHRAIAEEPAWSWMHRDAKTHLQHEAGDPAELKARLRELGSQWRYAPQEPVLLPPEYLAADTKGGLPSYLRDISRPKAGTTVDHRGVHISDIVNLKHTDPAFYGTGHQGMEYKTAKAGVRGAPLRTYFYVGEPGTIAAEQSILQPGRPSYHAYEAELHDLYDPVGDPAGLIKLVNAYGRDNLLMENSHELERLLHEYGYSGGIGVTNARDTRGVPQRAAWVTEPTPVKRIPAKKDHRGYAEGGLATG